MIRIAICDDDRAFLTALQQRTKEYLAKGPYGDQEFEIRLFDKPEALLEEPDFPDILFLDVDMPGLNGFETAEKLPKKTVLLFVSNFDRFVFDSFRHSPLRYLRKSKLDAEFDSALLAALNEVVMRDGCLKLDGKNFNKTILYSEIRYLESTKNYVVIHCENGGEYTLRSTVTELEEQLRPFAFFRCHRAFLVNAAKIRHIQSDTAVLTDGSEIKITRNYKQSFIKAYLAYYRK